MSNPPQVVPDKLALLVCGAGFALLGLLGYMMWRSAFQAPYLMNIKPAGDGAVVQFVQPESSDGVLLSPSFNVPVQVDQASQVELISPKMSIPAGQIEFADVTLTPGRFTIRFGDKTIDVMEARIIVDGISHEWQPDRYR